MICAWRTFREQIFEDGWFLKLTIDNQLDHAIIVVYLAMADIDTYEFVSMACSYHEGYHQYQRRYLGFEDNQFHCLIGNLYGK